VPRLYHPKSETTKSLHMDEREELKDCRLLDQKLPNILLKGSSVGGPSPHNMNLLAAIAVCTE
jgi:hypothetical protein